MARKRKRGKRKFFTTSELAELCRSRGRSITTERIRQLIKSGEIFGYKTGRDFMVPRDRYTEAWVKEWVSK